MNRPIVRRTLPAALAAVTAVALALRTVGLGGRVMHWDEGRVGYWILRYAATGAFEYRPIIHGPFVQHANVLLFRVLPPTDAVARLPVATVGGLLPAAAWLFRDRLRRSEVVALAGLLALNPLLVYYSRFMRSDVLVGAFAVAALGFAVRAWDRRSPRPLYPGAVTLALAFASKENAFVYVACFLGGVVLLYDHRLVRASDRGTESDRGAESDRDGGVAPDGGVVDAPLGAMGRLRADAGLLRGGLARCSGERSTVVWTLGHLAGVSLAFLAVVAFMYAPRPELYRALADPGALPAVVEAGTLGAWEKFAGLWGTAAEHDYLPYLYDLLETLVYGAPIVLVLAAAGFVADGYVGVRSHGGRALVAFATYWGVASVVGYPVATDIRAPWAAVHVVIPLSIPAAVGLVAAVDVARDALDAEDAATLALAGTVVLAAVVVPVGLTADYWNAASNEDGEVLQWAQPANDMRATLSDIEAIAATNDGVDVRFVGTDDPDADNTLFHVANGSSLADPPPGGPSWHSRLPLPWYLERSGATVSSTSAAASDAEAAADAPPVVIAYDFDYDAEAVDDPERVHAAADLAPHLEGYEARRHAFKLRGEHVVVFVDPEALAAARDEEGDAADRRRGPVVDRSPSTPTPGGPVTAPVASTPLACPPSA